MTVKRPLNYYGSKERLCPTIHALIPPDVSTWVDLFCGSAVVTLSKPRHDREVINDLNHDIVNLFDVLRSDRAGELYQRIELTPYAEELLRRVYVLKPASDPVEQAWRFLITSWFGRGGDNHKTGFRWSKGQNTSPEFIWTKMPDRLRTVATRLRGICIRNADALKIIKDYDRPDCCLFVDPPYPGDVGRRYAVKMRPADHEALAAALRDCSARIIMTMNPGTLYDQALSSWHRTDVTVMGGRAAKKPEVILTNFQPLPLLAARPA